MINFKMIAALVARDSRFWHDPMIPEASDFLDGSREDRLASWFGVGALGLPVPDVPLFPSVLDPETLVVSVVPPRPDEEFGSFLVRSADAAWIYEVSDVGLSDVPTLDNLQTEVMSRVDPVQTDRVLCEVVGLTSTEGPLFRLPRG